MLRLNKFIAVALFMGLVAGPRFAFADPLAWQTPYGTIGLPFQSTEALLGYDAILRQAIAGASLPVYQSPLRLLALQVGAVGAWPNAGAIVEPYIAGGLDVLRLVPTLNEFSSAHLNVFARYASKSGKVGMGIAVSYAFAIGVSPTPNP